MKSPIDVPEAPLKALELFPAYATRAEALAAGVDPGEWDPDQPEKHWRDPAAMTAPSGTAAHGVYYGRTVAIYPLSDPVFVSDLSVPRPLAGLYNMPPDNSTITGPVNMTPVPRRPLHADEEWVRPIGPAHGWTVRNKKLWVAPDEGKFTAADRTLLRTIAVKVGAVALLFGACVAAQVTASFSPQPLAAFKAAFGSKLPGVAVFDVTVCSASATDVDAGRIVQAAQTQIATVNRVLVSATLAKARRTNARYRLARILEWASWVGGFLTAGGVISAAPELAAIFPIVSGASHRLADEFEGQVPSDLYASQFLEGRLSLPAGGCATRLLLGAYQRGQRPFQVAVAQ